MNILLRQRLPHIVIASVLAVVALVIVLSSRTPPPVTETHSTKAYNIHAETTSKQERWKSAP